MQSDELEDWAIRWISTEGSGAAEDARPAQIRAEVTRALAHPIACLPLRDAVRANGSVTVVFDPTDAACPNDVIVPALIDELQAADVPAARITLLMSHSFDGLADQRRASAAHPPAWLAPVLHTRAVQHDPFDVQAVNQLGVFQRVPLSANYHAVEADFLIATGSVLPHRLAQYSGSALNVGVGCAGEATINELFTASLDDALDEEDVPARSSAFAQIAIEASERAGLKFCIECSDARTGDFVARAGAPARVHETMIEILTQRAIERGARPEDLPGVRRSTRSPWASVGARPWVREAETKPDPRGVITLTQ